MRHLSRPANADLIIGAFPTDHEGLSRSESFEHQRDFIRQVLIVDPQNPVYCDTLSQIQLARGEIEEAIQWAEKAVALDPGNESHQRTLAAARAAKGN